jgi:3-oxoacyl-[acyl-carrier protein] reductase
MYSDMTFKSERRLEGRVAVVTGASRGIGRATALTFAHEGAKAVVNYRREQSKAEGVVEKINEMGGEAFAFKADVSDPVAVEKMIDETMDRFAGVDILVNNAGIYMGQGSLLEFDMEDFDPMWDVNVKGVLNCTRAIASHMMNKRYGKVVNISSVAGLGTASYPGNMLYSSTKAAVIVLTKRLALELGQYGININAIAPGLILTDMAAEVRSPNENTKEFLRSRREKRMLRRLGRPDDVANVALFLASDESSFITGQVISVDGGLLNFITHSY